MISEKKGKTKVDSLGKLKMELESLSAKKVKQYAIKNYPELYHFHNGSKESIINKIVTYKENSEILEIIARRASQ